ncbi:MAG: hypothetical protein RLZZ511_2152 [Cyanobacteriota bacterium]
MKVWNLTNTIVTIWANNDLPKWFQFVDNIIFHGFFHTVSEDLPTLCHSSLVVSHVMLLCNIPKKFRLALRN